MIATYEKKAKVGMGLGFALLIIAGGLIGDEDDPSARVMAFSMVAYSIFVWGGFMLVKAKRQPMIYGIAAMSGLGALLLLLLKDKSHDA